MTNITSETWFWWAVALVVGVPALIVALGEVQVRLARRDNALAKPIKLLRNLVVPVAALLALVALLYAGWEDEPPLAVQIVATLFGFLLLLFVLSSLNAAMFLNAEKGSWRRRTPRIFVDLVRLVLIVIGVAILLANVWDANVGGMFAALGVTGIVVGLALQNAVGGIISGLLLLFEQPFEIGDWLSTGSISGRVVEVNWRAVHIETGNEIHIVPNASLAGAPFANLSRPTRDYAVAVESSFAVDDMPAKIVEVLNEVAADLPRIRDGGVPRTWSVGAGTYATSLPVETYADADAARAAFLRRIWYASRRAGLHLDKADPAVGTGPKEVEAALRQVSSALYLSEDDIGPVASRLRLETFAPGERIHRAGTVPADVSFIIRGEVLSPCIPIPGRSTWLAPSQETIWARPRSRGSCPR